MKSPKANPPTPPPLPTRDQAASGAMDSGNGKRKGYQSTILGGQKTAAAEQSPLKTLLGQ